MVKGGPRLFQKRSLKFNHSAVVHFFRVPFGHILKVFLRKKLHFQEFAGTDEQRLPCKRREALVRRVAEAGRTKRQDLPQMLSGLLQKINEIVSALPHISDPVRGRKGSGVDKNPGNSGTFFYDDRFRLCGGYLASCVSPLVTFFNNI